MFTLIHQSINGEETFKFKTFREIDNKIREIENSYTIYDSKVYYAEDGVFEEIVIITKILIK